MSRRLGYWLDYRQPYLTMSAPYIESVWWSLKELHAKGLLEKGHYVLPYCPRCETPLSSHEVAQGYKETTDPSVTVRIVPSEGTRRGPPRFPARLDDHAMDPPVEPARRRERAGLAYVGVRGADGEEEILAEAALARYFPAGPRSSTGTRGASSRGSAVRPAVPVRRGGPRGATGSSSTTMVDPRGGDRLRPHRAELRPRRPAGRGARGRRRVRPARQPRRVHEGGAARPRKVVQGSPTRSSRRTWPTADCSSPRGRSGTPTRSAGGAATR